MAASIRKANRNVCNYAVLACIVSSDVLANVVLDVAPRQLVSILGASKSTLLRIAAGLIAPHAGSVRLDDALLERTPPGHCARLPGRVPVAVALG
ncbi:hypothetical protein ACLKMY_21075 [Paraburkholderia mimosarum]|uniref:hypothetical protein n=1 Tax=Paraburkholderia mimosarum TaxID=312026 RepID=UPI0039C34B0D